MIEETYKLVPTGEGFTKTITSKRLLWIYQGGTATHPGKGHLCAKLFGLCKHENFLIQFVSGPYSGKTELAGKNDLKLYQGKSNV